MSGPRSLTGGHLRFWAGRLALLVTNGELVAKPGQGCRFRPGLLEKVLTWSGSRLTDLEFEGRCRYLKAVADRSSEEVLP